MSYTYGSSKLHLSEISCHSLASSSSTPRISRFKFVPKACMLHSGTLQKLCYSRSGVMRGKIWSPRGLSDPSYVRHWFNHSYFKLLCCILLLHEQLHQPPYRAPATSLEDVICRPSAPSCSRATSWTILEFTWTQGSSWIVRWANYVKLLSPASVANSASIAHQGIATHISPRLRYESGRSLQRSSVRVSFLSSRQASVRVELGRSADPEHPQVQQHISCHPRRAPLASNQEIKIALMVRHCLVGAAPEYLMELCHPVGSAVGRQCLWSASRCDLVVPRFRLQTFGHRAFAVSGPQIWNSLPLRIRQSRDNLLLFKQKLKAHLFQQFWALLWIHIWWRAL